MTLTKFDLMKEIAIFGGLRSDIIQFLLESAPTVELDKGETLFREGDESQCMYVLERGRLAVSKQWQSKAFLLKELDVGECLGEMALFDFMPRSATVIALEASILIELSSSALLNLYYKDLEQFTLLQMNMGREVTRRLREADRALFQSKMSTHVVDGKIVNVI